MERTVSNSNLVSSQVTLLKTDIRGIRKTTLINYIWRKIICNLPEHLLVVVNTKNPALIPWWTTLAANSCPGILKTLKNPDKKGETFWIFEVLSSRNFCCPAEQADPDSGSNLSADLSLFSLYYQFQKKRLHITPKRILPSPCKAVLQNQNTLHRHKTYPKTSLLFVERNPTSTPQENLSSGGKDTPSEADSIRANSAQVSKHWLVATAGLCNFKK